MRGPAIGSETGDSGPLTVGQQFGSRYLIVRLLGIGGMGAVYQAWDNELDVVVALKVILPEVASDPEHTRSLERRFKQELLLARKITHKNVVRIHDLGEIDGIKYITMSYVDGQDLASLLKGAITLPVPAALSIMRQVASGLVAAHQAGVVHRDLKPANIMVEGDTAVIMDFGIARGDVPAVAPVAALAGLAAAAAAPASPQAWHRVDARGQGTLDGAVVGTIAYMAPEQARGQPVDQRADVYAFGLIMSDLLLGLRPRSGSPSQFDELQRRMREAPPSLRTVNSQIPAALDAIVTRCVAPDPAARFQTSSELAAALERLDARGQLLPLVRRVTRRTMTAAAILVIVLLAGTSYLTRRAVEPVVQPDPVSVVIADVQNDTGEAAFDRTLEPMLRRALEGAGFITAYDRSRARALGVAQPERLDAIAARELAVQEGLGVVLAAAIGPAGGGYRITMRATHAVTGTVLATQEGRASGQDEVLDVATRLIGGVRSALGDGMSEAEQQFAMGSLSATSLEVVRLYAAGLEASSRTRFAEARDYGLKAVALDPDFGIGYLLLAAASRNLGHLDDDQKYLGEALRHLDGMTERERFSTRGYSYWAAGDYEQCVKEYGELVARYPSDIGGYNQLALCQSHLRQLRAAVDGMQKVVAILPSHPLFRHNLALYANYASDFETAEREASAIEEGDPNAVLALAFAQLGQGRTAEARQSYETLSRMGAAGASAAASGLGDLASVEGRFGEAVRILRRGAAADLAAENPDAAASKLVAAAHAEASRGQLRAAIAAADEALSHSTRVHIRFLAARTFIEAGDPVRARPIIDALSGELYPEPQAHAKVLQGIVALRDGDARRAMTVLREANTQFDTWIGLYYLGRASLDAGALAQADSAFDAAVNARRGEALSLFVDEEPTFAHLAPAYYYLGRVREELKSGRYADSYHAYLALRGQSTEDPLLPDVRRRAQPR